MSDAPGTSTFAAVIRLVLLDIDGTLIRTGGAGVKAFARAFATEFNLTDGAERLQFAGRTDTALAREFFLKNGIEPSAENSSRFFDSYVFWLDYFLARTQGRVIPGVRHFLSQLRALPQPPIIGLLTGNIRLGAEIKLRHFNLWEVFQTGAFGDDHEERDQIAAIARQRGSRLLHENLRGDQILVVGDTPHDIRCGKAIEAKVLAVATGVTTLAQLRKHQPDWLVEDLREAPARELCQ